LPWSRREQIAGGYEQLLVSAIPQLPRAELSQVAFFMKNALGTHALRGVEIYKDEPIFYGLGDFVFQVSPIPQPDMEAIAPATDQTPTERARAVWAGTFQPRYFEAIVAECLFENGKLREIRLRPL
jgi:hypothetical protein